jgi:hypothetical protein
VGVEAVMTQDEIIELARQAWSDSGESWVAYGWFEDRAKALEAFAKLVAEKEREACAKLVDYWEAREGEHADAIRARNNQ